MDDREPLTIREGAPEDRTHQAGVGSLNYDVLPGLEGVCLEDSFVRQVVHDGETLRFVLAAALLREHPYFDDVRSNEKHCYRSATLTFSGAQLIWRERTQHRFTDAAGAVDLGNIDVFVAPATGGYHLEGDWGVLDVVRSRAPVFTVVAESPPLRTFRRDVLAAWVRGEEIPHDHEQGHEHGHPERGTGM